MANGIRLGQPVVFRPGTAHDERWGPGQQLSGMVVSISGNDASLLLFPDAEQPFFEVRVRRDDALSADRTWTPTVGESQTLPEAPADGIIYGRQNQAWTPIFGEDGSFGSISAVVISDTPPAQPIVGMAWLDTTINNFFIYEQSVWVEPAHVNPPSFIAVNLTLPRIVGELPPTQGNPSLTVEDIIYCSEGEWSNSPTEFQYQWWRNNLPVSGATTNSFQLSLTDAGKLFYCGVRAMNVAGISEPVYSNSVMIDQIAASYAPPEIFGANTVGYTLTCTQGQWTYNPTSFHFEWYRDGIVVPSSDTQKFMITYDNFGESLTCLVTATNPQGTSAPASSLPYVVCTPAVLDGELVGATLSNGDLTATCSSVVEVARGASTSITKDDFTWYFEVTIGPSFEGAKNGVGLIVDGAFFDNMVTGNDAIVVFKDGTIFSNGADTGLKLDASLAPGNVVQFAVSFNLVEFWVRINLGDWNADPSAQPGGTTPPSGGISFTALAATPATLAPAVCFGGQFSVVGDSVTFNFGATPFQYPVPLRFNPGWTTGNGLEVTQ